MMSRKGLEQSIILILDPRGITSRDRASTDFRLNGYGQDLNKIVKNSKLELVVFSSSRHRFRGDKNIGFVRIFHISNPTINPIRFAFASKKYLEQNNFNVKLIFPTDPWESFLSAYILKYLLKKNISIYTQVHADIGSKKWKTISLKNLARFYLAKITLPRSDAIRCVSEPQLNNLLNHFKIKQENINVIPVPIRLSNTQKNLGFKRPRTIGFVGRIQGDRGVRDFIRLISNLEKAVLDYSVVIVGEGNLKHKFLKSLSQHISSNRIKFTGYIPNDEMFKIWPQIGVLASMATIESYGMVLREALVNSVPIWTYKTSGSQELFLSDNQNDFVKLIDLNKDYKELANDFEMLINAQVSEEIKSLISNKNKKYSELLANSWINEIVKSKEEDDN